MDVPCCKLRLPSSASQLQPFRLAATADFAEISTVWLLIRLLLCALLLVAALILTQFFYVLILQAFVFATLITTKAYVFATLTLCASNRFLIVLLSSFFVAEIAFRVL